jgi:hypothetical protein
MRSPKQVLADHKAWAPYWRQLAEMDCELDRLEPGTAEYDAAWHDRMGYAANRYPGAPEPDLGEPEAGA